jgi:preprotein translocase subunit YajC
MDPQLVQTIIMIAMLFGIMYFFMIRPQQKRLKEHQEMVSAIRRGDTVVTAGGLIGKVTKVIDDNEAMVEIAEGVRVRVIRQTVTDVRSKSDPSAATPPKPAND